MTAASVLMLWTGRLGDFIVSTPFIRSFAMANPDARVSVLTSPQAAGLVTMLPFVKQSLVFPKPPRPAAAWAFARDFKSLRPDLCVDLNPSSSTTSALLAFFSGAPDRLAFRKDKMRFCYTRFAPAPKPDAHMIDKYRLLASHMGIEYDPALSLEIAPSAQAEADNLIAGIFGLNTPFITLHPGNFGKYDHRWPEEKFVELAKRLAAEGLKIAFIAGPGESEKVKEIAAPAGPACRVMDSAPLPVLAAVFKKAALAIDNPTGTMHLAAAAGAKLLSLQSGYTHKVWRPLSPGCFCIKSENWNSVRDIPVKTVYDAAIKILSGKSSADAG